MTLVTLRPDATVQITAPVSVNGAVGDPTTAHTLLSDDLDTTAVTMAATSQGVWVTFANLTLPPGHVVRSTTIRARVKSQGGAAYLVAQGVAINVGLSAPTGYLLVQPGEILTLPIATDVALEDPGIDNYSCVFYRYGGPAGLVLALYEAYLDIVHVAKPLVAVDAPTGTVDTTNLPVVSWTPTLDPDGGLQTHYRVRIFSEAQYTAGGFDPALGAAVADSERLRSSDLFWQSAVPLADGNYRAYVKLEQNFKGGVVHESAWAYTQFAVMVDRPAAPLLALLADSAAGRIVASIDSNGGEATTQAVELQRSDDGAVSWVAVRNAGTIGAPLAAAVYPVSVTDYEARNGLLTRYRARALHDYGGVWAASPWAVSPDVSWSSPRWWIKDLARPELNVGLYLKSYGAIARAARSGTFQALGAKLPIVISDTRAGATGQITIVAVTGDELDALDAVLASTGTLLLQGPVDAGEPDRYVRFGDCTATRLVEQARHHRRDVSLPWTEVADPTAFGNPPRQDPLTMDGGAPDSTFFGDVDGGAP